MAGQPKTRAATGKSKPEHKGEGSLRNNTTRRRSNKRRRIFGELVQIAADQGHPIVLGISTSEALQGCLDRAVALFRFAAQKVDSLSEDELWEIEIGPNGATATVPSRWRLMEDEARKEIETLAGMMTSLGIAERTVRIEEAKAALLVAHIRDAALASGISHDQVRQLGIELRRRIEEQPAARINRSNLSASQNPATSQAVASDGPGHGPSAPS